MAGLMSHYVSQKQKSFNPRTARAGFDFRLPRSVFSRIAKKKRKFAIAIQWQILHISQKVDPITPKVKWPGRVLSDCYCLRMGVH